MFLKKIVYSYFFPKGPSSLGAYPPADYEQKPKIAQRVKHQLENLGISLYGKAVLDVGTGYGFNAKVMSDAAAHVTGVDVDEKSLNTAVAIGNLSTQARINKLVQALPKSQSKKYDLATIFLWNIPYAEREAVMTALTKLIKPDGKIIVGLFDEEYIFDPSIDVEKLARRYFTIVKSHFYPNEVNRKVLVLEGIRPTPLPVSDVEKQQIDEYYASIKNGATKSYFTKYFKTYPLQPKLLTTG